MATEVEAWCDDEGAGAEDTDENEDDEARWWIVGRWGFAAFVAVVVVVVVVGVVAALALVLAVDDEDDEDDEVAVCKEVRKAAG